MSFHQEVWETLSKIDVSEHTEDKGGFTYLSWTWALSTLWNIYPAAQFRFTEWDGVPALFYSDGTAEVECTVWVPDPSYDNEDAQSGPWAGDVIRKMSLPVMDHTSRRSLKDPDSFSIGSSKQRCLVKTIGLLGLGFYLYAGEDLPPGTPKKDDAPKKAAPSKKTTPSTPSKEDDDTLSMPDEEPAKTKANGKPPEEQESQLELIPSPDKVSSIEGTENFFREFLKDQTTLTDYRNWWLDNGMQKQLDTLKENQPEIHERVIALLSEHKRKLEEKNNA